MKGDNLLINIRHTNGDIQRVERHRAEELVSAGRAQFISNTLFKAAQAGVKVDSKLSDTEIKELIRKARKPEPKKKEIPDDQVATEKQPKKQRKGSRKR